MSICSKLVPVFYSNQSGQLEYDYGYTGVLYTKSIHLENTYGGAATIWIFHLLWQKYSYLTQSSIMELLLSVS